MRKNVSSDRRVEKTAPGRVQARVLAEELALAGGGYQSPIRPTVPTPETTRDEHGHLDFTNVGGDGD